MKALPILIHPHPNLRRKAKPVTAFDDSLAELVENMIYTMYQQIGIGLSATQVNVPLRVIVVDVSDDKDSAQSYINPLIKSKSGLQTFEEGCLSVPGFFEAVDRPDTIHLVAQDVNGNTFEKTVSGLEATCIQHEIDHLNGKLFVDYLSRLKQSRIRQKLIKAHAA